ncbi:MAG: glycosyltransferase [Bacteroidetes bacterium]|nr:glycosyltransferase [Bacteroidota bacterium]
MPTYNNSEYVSLAIRSILNQTFGNFEFLIIDDYSSDDTINKIEAFNDKRIRLIVNDKNTGLGNTLNKGLRESKFELIARMDGDDISLPERLEKQFKFMNEYGHIHVLSCHYAMFSGSKVLFDIRTCTEHEDIKRRLSLHSEVIHPGVMYRKSVILDHGGYSGGFIEDYELWLRIKDKIRFHNLPETLLLKRYHGKSISLDIEKKNRTVYSYTEKYFINPVAEFGITKSGENIIRGWREYFYGSKKSARAYFRKAPAWLFLFSRIFPGYLSTFLSKGLFVKFREMRIRFRISYLLNYFSERNRKIRNFLRQTGSVQDKISP